MTPSSPFLWLALPQALCLIRRPLYHQRGPIVGDLHGLNSHGGIIVNAPINKAGDTTMQSHQPTEIIQIGFTLTVTKAPHVTQCLDTECSLTDFHTSTYKNTPYTTSHLSTHQLSLEKWFTRKLYGRNDGYMLLECFWGRKPERREVEASHSDMQKSLKKFRRWQYWEMWTSWWHPSQWCSLTQVPKYTSGFRGVLIHLSWEKYRHLVHDITGKYA